MVIILDTPFSLGDLSTETYPHVYVTNLLINGPAQTVTVMAEVGKVGEGYSWQSAPANTQTQLNLSGEQLIPFFFQKPSNMDESLWDQTETLVYQEIQKAVPRYAGKLGSGLPEATPAEEPKTPEAEPEAPAAEPATETAPETETAPDASA
jgi:hypothetical protein